MRPVPLSLACAVGLPGLGGCALGLTGPQAKDVADGETGTDNGGNGGGDSGDSGGSDSGAGDSGDSGDSAWDTGPIVLEYPDHRVGMFYLTWHAYAYDAVARLDPSARLTVEDVIRGGDLQFSDMIYDAGLYSEAAAFHWHQEPALGFYSLYRPRDGEPAYDEPNAAVAYPDTAAIAEAHARLLWEAGVDFVYVDLTNLPAMSDFSDVLGVRPLEVLLEEWGALRSRGVATPQVAAWVPAIDVGGSEPTFRRVLDAYDAAVPDLVLTHDGQEVLFTVDSTGSSSAPAYLAEIASRGVLAVPMWGNLGAGPLAAGVAGWMQPCTSGGGFTTLVSQGAACTQGYTTSSPLGSVVSVSRSFQVGYASLPFQASGRLGGLTFQKQVETALAAQPDYLLINAWNEHIAQPQANPYDASLGPLRRSMGVTDAPSSDASADWLWVDMYGADLNRDFEPTVEDGGAGYALLQSCLRVYRSGATACVDTSEMCCQLADDPVLVLSVRVRGGATSGDHVPTLDRSEVDSLVATGAWEEVCNPHYGPPGLCGGGTTGDGPFGLYTSGGSGRVGVYRCYTGLDHFLSTDGTCEGTTYERLLGYAATTPSSDAPRALTRCLGSVHLHWLDAPCPAGTTGEAVLGYVR